MLLRTVFLISLFLGGTHAAPPLDDARLRELARSPRWLRLLHYKSHWFTGYESAVDGPGFFFSPAGKEDPEKELRATLIAFQARAREEISKLKQPPACAFPARFRFLNEELGLGWPTPKCDRWQEFFGRFRGAESVTLVFSTAYPNNPASMFGHTFLRINGRAQPGQEKLDLLDHGISYAAQVPDDENNFLFMWFGLTGGYMGTFSAIPYYAKVQEYVSSESRDLWEYDLNVNAQETWWLLANVWELEVNAYTDYYFFDENCSFEILTLLEVAKPDWSVANYVFHMIPGESVKKVTAVPGAVKRVKFRPSLFRKLMAYGDRLNAKDREEFSRLILGEGVDSASVGSLDTAIQYFYYLKQQKEGKLAREEAEIFEKVLLARNRRKEASPPEPAFDQSSRPDWGHHPSRISLGYGRMQGAEYGSFQEFGLKFAYHDLLNHDVGFVPFSEISFPNLRLRYFPREDRFFVQRLEFLSIHSLSPWNWLKNSLSWKATVAYEVPMDHCSFCHVLHADGNVGISHSIAGDRLRAYELLGLYADLGKELQKKWRAGPRFTAGLLANVTRNWKHHLESTVSYDPWLGGRQKFFVFAEWGQSFFFAPEWEARLLARAALRTNADARGRDEIQAQILYYF